MRARWLLVLALAGCATTPPPRATEADLPRARAIDPAADLVVLERGRIAFRESCVGCHDLPDPARRAPAAWPEVVDKMADANPKFFRLDPRDRREIKLYLETVGGPRGAR